MKALAAFNGMVERSHRTPAAGTVKSNFSG
jgi:hypothetical protein